jgi:hypothetical protein
LQKVIRTDFVSWYAIDLENMSSQINKGEPGSCCRKKEEIQSLTFHTTSLSCPRVPVFKVVVIASSYTNTLPNQKTII